MAAGDVPCRSSNEKELCVCVWFCNLLGHITGGEDLTLFELDEAANRIREEVDPAANIIVGSTMDTSLDGGMRVSVVATGIDASEVIMDTPVARRKLSEPLKQAEPEPAPAPVAAAPVAAPEEPALFSEFDVEQAASEDQMEDLFEEQAPAATDDLPPPAYQPQVAQFLQPQTEYVDEAPEAFVAPKAPAPGTPSPEALARLRTAVSKVPSAPPEREKIVAVEPAPQPEERKFGINSLIGRMTGHSKDAAAQVARREPQMQPAPMEEEEQDRIEIPAFLRRQAN